MRLRLTRGHMKTIVWIVASLFVWLVFSTAGCGGVECAPYVAVGYAPFWIPMLVYGAVSEWISRRFAGRWAAPCFVTLMAAGTIVLLCALVIYYPAIFNEAAAFDVRSFSSCLRPRSPCFTSSRSCDGLDSIKSVRLRHQTPNRQARRRGRAQRDRLERQPRETRVAALVARWLRTRWPAYSLSARLVLGLGCKNEVTSQPTVRTVQTSGPGFRLPCAPEFQLPAAWRS
jgi:hypothetical protein